MKHVLLALVLAATGLAHSIHAQDTERRFDEYRCAVRLPTPDFAWLTKDEMPGATLACRDSNDRFVILIVTLAPPGYRIDARQGSAFEKGMNRAHGIELLSGRLTEFLGVPCYEIRGRLKTDESLTLSRYFAANGFLYNLQAMITAVGDGKTANFDELFAAFRFIDPVPANASIQTTEASTVPSFTPAPTARAAQDIQAGQQAQTRVASAGNLPKVAKPTLNTASWNVVVIAGVFLGAISSIVLLWMFRARE